MASFAPQVCGRLPSCPRIEHRPFAGPLVSSTLDPFSSAYPIKACLPATPGLFWSNRCPVEGDRVTVFYGGDDLDGGGIGRVAAAVVVETGLPPSSSAGDMHHHDEEGLDLLQDGILAVRFRLLGAPQAFAGDDVVELTKPLAEGRARLDSSCWPDGVERVRVISVSVVCTKRSAQWLKIVSLGAVG